MRRTAASHSEWISLLDVSGPFLSRRSLQQAFPNGLDTCDPDVMREYRLVYEEWLANRDTRFQNVWVEYVLSRLLEYEEAVLLRGEEIPASCVHREPEHREEVRPSIAVVSSDDPGQVVLPILVFPRNQRLGSPMADMRWSASPTQRMYSLLRSAGIPIGLVTNGSEWCLIHIKETETTGFIVFRADIMADEPIVLRAFYNLLGVRRVIGAPDGERLHELLLASRDDEEELTTDLGRQVRVAVELLVREIDHLDADSGRELLTGIPDGTIYNATLTVMMRLMFLLCAEERKLLPIDESDTFVTCYAASTLLNQLEQDKQLGEEILERRHDAWLRLMATARLIFTGSARPELQLTAYGGSLFDPEKYPFLERLRVNNRIVLHILESLQYIVTEGPTGKEHRRVSFEALDVEQIGYVYEGLLDHTAVRAADSVLGLIGKPGDEPEIALSVLEAKSSAGDKELLKLLNDETNRAEKALQKLLDAEPDLERSEALEVACGGDALLKQRIMPYLGLLRFDPIGRLQVYPKGALYVTVSDQRRGAGAHYTPRFLAEEVVQYALEPLVYQGPSEGTPREEWKLRDARHIVNLRVADIAMGSGAFLVAACRYLSARLVEAWNAAEALAGQRLAFTSKGEFAGGYDPARPQLAGRMLATPFGQIAIASPDEELLPVEPDERLASARRIIADRCLYGVDINPMATEMAKLSLWLITLRRDRPFTFVDHALKCGDSLVGVSLEELQAFSLTPHSDRGDLLIPWVQDAVNQVTNLRRLIRQVASNTPLEVLQRAGWHKKAEEYEEALRAAANLLLMEAFSGIDEAKRQNLFNSLHERPTPEEARTLAAELGRRSFHFPLEFPDVFADGGFHAVVGNPPFVGGQRITGAMGEPFRNYLVSRVAHGKRGSADLCAYFFLRAVCLLRDDGYLGYLATNTISQGDTREVGLDQLLLPAGHKDKPDTIAFCNIYRSVKSVKWPSKSANLEVAKIWLKHGSWLGACVLDDVPVGRITAFLDDGSASGKPFRLKANAGKSFQGSIVLGMGFVMEPEQAEALIVNDPRNKDVLFPYLNGEDLNSRPDQSPSRWVINFFDWPLGRIGQSLPVSGETMLHYAHNVDINLSDEWRPKLHSRWGAAEEERRGKWLRIGVVPEDYPGPVAADYPDILTLVETSIRPERARNNREVYRRMWWHYAEKRPELYLAIANNPVTYVRARVSNVPAFSEVPTGWVMSEQLVVMAYHNRGALGVLSSSVHQVWVVQLASTLGKGLRYTPTDCAETFPFPAVMNAPQLVEAIDNLVVTRKKWQMDNSMGLGDYYKEVLLNQDEKWDEHRRMHIRLDNAVLGVYGWGDIELRHDYYGFGHDARFAVSPDARNEILRRLLKLNHERYAEEVAAGLHDKGAKKTKPWSRKSPDGMDSLFGEREIEEAE